MSATSLRPDPAPAAVRTRPRGLSLLLSAGTVVAVAVALIVLAATGQLRAAAPPFDPGPVVRYGLPALRVVHDLSAALTVGLLALITWAVGPEAGGRRHGRTEPAARHALGKVRVSLLGPARAAVTVWLVSALAVLVLSASDVSGFPVGAPGFGSVLISFVGQVELGRALGVSLLLVAVVATLILTATRVTTLAWAAALSLLALLPLSLAGHAAGSRDHMNAVDSLAFHLVAVCLWVGGLIALVITSGRLGEQRSRVVARFSFLAGWCFAAVAISGLVNAALRLGSVSALASGYGALVIGKAGCLVLLGVIGWLHRRRTVPQLDDRPRLFARLAAVELMIMAATIGLAVGLSRSAPPSSGLDVDVVTSLLGYPAPPPLTVHTYLTTFYPDMLWLSVAVVGAAVYLVWVVRLHRRGDPWPWYRVVFWLAGCLALALVTSGGIAVYGRIHFSSHMIQHMSLMVAVPLLCVFGAPITLAMRAMRPRTDGSLGARETLLLVVHSRPLAVLGKPVVAAALFAGGLVIFYYTRLFSLAMFTHTGHVLMTAHFLGAGYLFIWSLVGPDPGPDRPPYPFRLVVLLGTLTFHAFFGISLMYGGTLLAPDWWHALGQTDDAALLADQQLGGGIAWGAGDLPSLLIGVALVIGWVQSDTRTSRQHDRQADRDGDAELRRYNEQLAALSGRGDATARPQQTSSDETPSTTDPGGTR